MTKDIARPADVIGSVCRLRGFDPETYEPSAKEREAWAAILTDAVRAVWEDQMWPMVVTVGRRRYRPEWNELTTYRHGMDVWHNGAYWHCAADCLGVEPAPGASCWALAKPLGYKFIAFEQPWPGEDGLLQDVLDPTGIEVQAFAYAKDPMAVPDALPVPACRIAADCVFLPDGAPDEPFVRYRPQAPEFTMEAWSAQADYAPGDVCLHGGWCWRCRDLAGLRGVEPSDAEWRWEKVGVPRFMLPYVRRRMRAELESEDEGKWRSEAAAEAELDRLRDKWMNTGNSRATVRWRAPGRAVRP